MMTPEITRKTVLLSNAGGILDIVSDAGEVLASVHVPAGLVRAAQYMDLLPYGAHFEVSEGLAAMQPPHRVGIQPYGPGATDSGANPDFRPTSASRLEKEMRVTLNRMKAATDRVEARARAYASIQQIPKAPAPAPEPDIPVIEPEKPQEPLENEAAGDE